MSEYIFDRYRQRYILEVQENSEQSYYIKIKDGDEYVGQLLCSFHPGAVMILEDLFIRNDTETPDTWGRDRKLRPVSSELQDDLLPGNVLKARWHSDNTEMNYRNRGLGSALLKLMIDLAKDKKVNTVLGSIVKKDMLTNPRLIRWYINRGFNITNQFTGCISGAETYIRFELINAKPFA
jgi:hypothetical protein